jgi:CorA-like Mg2+ transporter protein
MSNIKTLFPKVWALPEAITQRLGSEAGPQRSMLEEGHLLIILHKIPKPDQIERVPALFWRQPAGQWFSTEPGSGANALAQFLLGYEERLLDLDQAEVKATTASEYHQVLEGITPVLRASRGLHRALQEARDMLKAERALIDFRDRAAGIERNAELLLQDAQFGLSFTAAKQAETQAQSAARMATAAHRLNCLAALFLPLGALTGIFGMEIHSGLTDTTQNFALVLGCGLAIGGALALAIGRR